MPQPDRAFLKAFFQQVTDRPLEPTDPEYVPIYEEGPHLLGEDPVELLARAIEFLPGESTQLLSGFRGTGKSTELRRLRKRLVEAGFHVVLMDIEDYLNTSSRVDVSDFLMALAGAFGEALASPHLLGSDPAAESYWARFVHFARRAKVEVPEVAGDIDVGAASVGLKVNLKSDPTFREKLQERMAGHLGALVKDVHAFFEECTNRLKKRHGPDRDVVLLVDSVEHIRGTSVNATTVQSSVETLFATHADKLRLPNMHVVYTVPPYLKVLHPNLGRLYDAGAVQVFPAIKLLDRATGKLNPHGVEAMRRVVEKRGDWRRLLGKPQVMERVILESGGQLRDLLRILAEIIRRAKALPVDEITLVEAINQIRVEFLPIADADAVWLARIARTHKAGLKETQKLPDLARFLDTHLVLCYRDGDEWYDVHPLVRAVVIEQAKAAAARPATRRNEKS